MVSVAMIDFDRTVAELGIRHRAKAARRTLMEAGHAATPAVRRGLEHPDPSVRAGCCQILDHYLDDDCIPALLGCLDDPDAAVRLLAVHALACERCKEGECRPGEDDVVLGAMRPLANDPDRHVRAHAAHALGPAVHRRPDALAALETATRSDDDPTVRKVAGWYSRGGPIYERLRPCPLRRSRASPLSA